MPDGFDLTMLLADHLRRMRPWSRLYAMIAEIAPVVDPLGMVKVTARLEANGSQPGLGRRDQRDLGGVTRLLRHGRRWRCWTASLWSGWPIRPASVQLKSVTAALH